MIIATLILGLIIGSAWREIYELIKKVKILSEKVRPKTKPQVTAGAYIPAQENKQTAHIINPKSPQRMEWESNQKTLEENNLVERSVRPQ